MKPVSFLLFASIASACSAQPSDPESFRNEMIARFSASNPGASFSRGSEPLVIDVKGGELDGGEINLHRVYEYCRSAAEADCETERKNLTDNLAAGAPEPVRDSLRIVVRDQEYVDYLEEMHVKEGSRSDRALYRQVGDDLYALIASDGPKTIAMVTASQLEEMDLTAEQGWQLAERNTKAIIPQLPEARQLKASAMAFQDMPYLSALVADLAGWSQIARAVGDELFMTVVSDQFVFVGTMPDSGVADFKATVADDCAAQPRCVSPNIYRFRNGRWVIAR